MIVVYLGMSFLLVFLLSECKQKSYDIPGDTPTSGVIAIAIDECLSPIVEEEITVFESICKEAGIVPYFSGETETINRLLHDSTRLAVTTRLLTEQETAFMNAKKLFPKAIQIATDAIALIVNKQNTDSIIGLPVLKEVLTGKIQDWKSLSPANKLGKIDVVFDNPNSSTVRYAIDSICGGPS